MENQCPSCNLIIHKMYLGQIQLSGNSWPSLGEDGRWVFIHWCSKVEWPEEERSIWINTGVWIHAHLLGFHNSTFISCWP